MSSLPSILEGSISSRALEQRFSGSVAGALKAPQSGSLEGDSPQNAAIANVGGLISSLGALSAQAQSLPLSPPTLPGLPQSQSYRPQTTDYTQFVDDSN